MTDARIPGHLRCRGSKDGPQLGCSPRFCVVPIEPAGDALLVGDGVIDLDVKEVRCSARYRAIDDVLGQAAIGCRKQREDLRHDRTWLEVWIVRKDIPRNRKMRGGVIQLRGWQKRGKVTFAVRLRGSALKSCSSSAEAESFIVEEEKRLIRSVVDVRNADRPAEGSAEIILRIHGLGQTLRVVRPAICIEGLVAEKVIDRTVVVIGARLQGQADDAVARLAILRAKSYFGAP